MIREYIREDYFTKKFIKFENSDRVKSKLSTFLIRFQNLIFTTRWWNAEHFVIQNFALFYTLLNKVVSKEN